MAQASHHLNTPFAIIANRWNSWKAAYDRALNNYYNQCIENNPVGEAQYYWQRLNHPQSSVNVHDITDAMLSRLMNSMIEQGISKFAVDCFILELRRLVRSLPTTDATTSAKRRSLFS
ncbi:hypothetical protein H6G89_03450 [Oscillatoria sp. FACHB-1407]|uniref:hypothetical protein n=1 Tax=Oscillatoria sp. FACHB-1407 TaxID=2692847 RepID=UPI001682E9F3|nr:hypothetical protein [Oscillatoria sp. FACHB-1407]MBD2460093.1 hypothetical protein [Oscillatoria sp. FACHB-1407]